MKLTKLQKLAEGASQNSHDKVIKIFEPLHDKLEIAYENIEFIRNQLQSSVLTNLLKAEGFPATEAKAAKDAAQIAFKAISDLEDEVRDLHQALGTHFEDKDYDSKPYPMAEAKAIPQTAAQALAKGLTAAFGHEITLSAAMVKALEGFEDDDLKEAKEQSAQMNTKKPLKLKDFEIKDTVYHAVSSKKEGTVLRLVKGKGNAWGVPGVGRDAVIVDTGNGIKVFHPSEMKLDGGK